MGPHRDFLSDGEITVHHQCIEQGLYSTGFTPHPVADDQQNQAHYGHRRDDVDKRPGCPGLSGGRQKEQHQEIHDPDAHADEHQGGARFPLFF